MCRNAHPIGAERTTIGRCRRLAGPGAGKRGCVMLEWMKKRRALPAPDAPAPEPDAARRHGRNKAGKYRLLYDYLENRYATTVVLTFGQIEDLLGFGLPETAHTDQEWWTKAEINSGEARCSDAWTLASRTARPN